MQFNYKRRILPKSFSDDWEKSYLTEYRCSICNNKHEQCELKKKKCKNCYNEEYLCFNCLKKKIGNFSNCYDCGCVLCDECVFQCENCGINRCGECNKDFDCFGCGESFCEDCFTKCNFCGENFCEGCIEKHSNLCNKCKK